MKLAGIGRYGLESRSLSVHLGHGGSLERDRAESDSHLGFGALRTMMLCSVEKSFGQTR